MGKCIWGNNLESKDVTNSLSCNNLENCVNVMSGGGGELDKNVNIFNSIEFGAITENAVGSGSFGANTYNVFFSCFITEAKNIYYSMDIDTCEEIMFSVGLRNKKYCILNKQYEKEQYFELKDRIINKLKQEKKWGEFTGFDLAFYPYNDTLAYDFFKVNKVIYSNGEESIIDKNTVGIVTLLSDDFITDAILDLGGTEKIKIKWRLKDKEINIAESSITIESGDIPNIEDIDDSILEKVILCEKTNRPFRIIKKELELLKKKGFPIPRVHHEERIDSLITKRPFGEFYEGVCDLCSKEMLSVYNEKQKYKVYCQDCYKNYIYG